MKKTTLYFSLVNMLKSKSQRVKMISFRGNILLNKNILTSFPVLTSQICMIFIIVANVFQFFRAAWKNNNVVII